MSIANLRKDYTLAGLTENQLRSHPVDQFSDWFSQAQSARLPEPNAMSLATVNAQGRPSSRIVLLKEFDQRGFIWFTHYASRKGHELEQSPFAALLFHWVELERQVRIEGRVERISDAESDAYFYSRPLASQWSALASQQSQPTANRAMLEQRYEEIKQECGDAPIRPDTWGGYRLVPDALEFWQGRPSRLHDRLLYSCSTSGEWHISRLQP